MIWYSGGFKGGRAGSAPTLYVTKILYCGHTIASPFHQTRKTWYSEYSKWLQPVAFWLL